MSQPAPAPTPVAEATPEADLAGARTLVDRIYRGYLPGAKQVDVTPLLAPKLRAVFADELDADPFCACQDFDDARYSITTIKATPKGAHAMVNFRNFVGYDSASTERVELDLVQIDGAWRVADIKTAGYPSLLGAK